MNGYENYDIKYIFMGLGLIAVLFVGFLLIMAYQKWKNRKRIMSKIRREWGKRVEREYDPTEFDCISHYYLNKETEVFQIDDITWNDLDMDRIFMELNHTRSFLGESYLYYQLRTPEMNGEKLEKFEKLVNWFEAHEKEREEMEYFFARIGKTGRNSVFDYVYNLAEADSGSSWIHFGTTFLILASVCVLLIWPQPGILMLIGSFIISMWTYERWKRPVEPYMISCIALEKVLNSAGEIGAMKIDGMPGEKIREAVGSFRKLRRNMVLLVAGGYHSDSIEQALIMLLNNLFHIDLLQFKTVVREAEKHLPEFEFLVEEIGRIESAIAVASFRRLYPHHTVPILRTDGPIRFCGQQMYHPLISDPVSNSLDTDCCILLTGSNASGKSTFLKTAALQVILAQTVHTVLAKRYEARYFRVFSSMALRDDLAGEESYYMVEIRSLKRILDRIEGEQPVFCCIDEVLRGTNTVERIAASSQILKWIAGKNLLCMAATHDIELTYLLDGVYRNCHFEEEVTETEVRFDYLLKEGRAMTRNAIRLLALMGFDESIIREAENLASRMIGTEREKMNKL
ncbi:MAG: DNA mismatch repair protein MutS [Candidatus Choladocola sp.]|nr:DNA mismatch repair protein MutS [Candidatus Choladocola sp.]